MITVGRGGNEVINKKEMVLSEKETILILLVTRLSSGIHDDYRNKKRANILKMRPFLDNLQRCC